jgi:hypothetical protein
VNCSIAQERANQLARLQEDLSQRVGHLEVSGSSLGAQSSNQLLQQQLRSALQRDVEELRATVSLELHALGSSAAEAATQAAEVSVRAQFLNRCPPIHRRLP